MNTIRGLLPLSVIVLSLNPFLACAETDKKAGPKPAVHNFSAAESADAPAASLRPAAEVMDPAESPRVAASVLAAALSSVATDPVVKTAPPGEALSGGNSRSSVKQDRAGKTAVFTLEIGEFKGKSALAEAKKKIRKAGLLPVVTPGAKKSTPVIRLYLAEAPNQAAAKKELDRLRAAKADSFVLRDANQKLQVYAGSYFDQQGAQREQQRLAALGIKVGLKPTAVLVPTYLLTAGSFRTQQAAEEKASALEKLGVKAVVKQQTDGRTAKAEGPPLKVPEPVTPPPVPAPPLVPPAVKPAGSVSPEQKAPRTAEPPVAAVPSAAAPQAATTEPPVNTVVPPPPAEVVAPKITLPRITAIAMAVYKNIDLRVESYNSEMARKDLAKSHGIYNPVLTLSTSGGVTAIPGDPFFSTKSDTSSVSLLQNLPTGGNITASTQTGFFSFNPGTSAKEWQSTAGLAISQPLLKNFGKEVTELNITLGVSSLQDSLEKYRSSTTDTVASVLTAYNHLYVLRKIEETRLASLNSAQKLLDEINKKAQQGPVQGMEKANAEFAIAQRRKDLIEASRNVKDQEASLRYLIGVEPKSEILPLDPPSTEEPLQTEAQAVKAALELRPDLKQLQLSLETSRLQERIAKKQALPDLSITATGGYAGTSGSIGGSYGNLVSAGSTYWTAGASLTVPLGNTALRNEYLKSQIKTQQLEDQIRALKWKIQNDVEADLRALLSARVQMHLADQSKQLSELRLEAYRKNNAAGTATIQDVINAENDESSANNGQLEAIETFSNAAAKLWKDTGLLLDHYNVHLKSN
jgi:outer membrane protein TolC